ncbi:MAG: tRNA (N(6)-L-threonylcarbamoyladenosine(37)-C(2))-methylthiotransferase MtaB [Thermodesulfobacteriota bacterium]|nr:tRNA (N(6)-L-threonylcarbamoyladenosine(37)-C(2))-methylthiotransferase MtaB [Thermodesulfobacteriota bacterium]
MKSFVVTTLGCKVNRYESEAISEQLIDRGWHLAEKGAAADLCVVNTCTVTGKAATQSRQATRRLIRDHPEALVVVTGCYAQVAQEVFLAMAGVHYVVGTSFKDQIPLLADSATYGLAPTPLVEDLSGPRPFQDLPLTRFGNRTRPFLKIQDGCNSFCSYCIIPYARGRSRSLRPELVAERIGALQASGYLEVVLCGIHVGQYGQDLDPASSLVDLLRFLDGPQSVQRLRISSIEPGEVSEGMISHMAISEHVCRHLHIPLQSGDDEVLKQMHRPYGAKLYRDLILHIVEVLPEVAIGVDVLVGFPGETEKAFDNTCRLIEHLPLAYLHVFPFSSQRGTLAEGLTDRVSPETIKRRCRHLRDMGQAKRMAFYERFIGTTQEVLIEGKRDRFTGCLKGFTGNYIPVHVKGDDHIFNQLVQVRLTSVDGGRVMGQCLSSRFPNQRKA